VGVGVVKEIPHNSRKHPDAVILVDDDVYEAVIAAGPWRPHRGSHSGPYSLYAIRHIRVDGRGATQYLHNFLAGLYGLPKSPDHVNRNGLDNRRENLRPATPSQQGANRDRYSNNTSGYKGVRQERGKWRARICLRGKLDHLGYFEVKEDAARAYNKAALEYFGEFAVLNLVNGVPL
jgi:AP2 domain